MTAANHPRALLSVPTKKEYGVRGERCRRQKGDAQNREMKISAGSANVKRRGGMELGFAGAGVIASRHRHRRKYARLTFRLRAGGSA